MLLTSDVNANVCALPIRQQSFLRAKSWFVHMHIRQTVAEHCSAIAREHLCRLDRSLDVGPLYRCFFFVAASLVVQDQGASAPGQPFDCDRPERQQARPCRAAAGGDRGGEGLRRRERHPLRRDQRKDEPHGQRDVQGTESDRIRKSKHNNANRRGTAGALLWQAFSPCCLFCSSPSLFSSVFLDHRREASQERDGCWRSGGWPKRKHRHQPRGRQRGQGEEGRMLLRFQSAPLVCPSHSPPFNFFPLHILSHLHPTPHFAAVLYSSTSPVAATRRRRRRRSCILLSAAQGCVCAAPF